MPMSRAVFSTWGTVGTVVGSASTPIRLACGTSSWSKASRLASSSPAKMLTPVTFPPGRAMLAANALPTMSSASPTIGIVEVARCAARIAGSPNTMITSTGRATRSAASPGKRSSRRSAHRKMYLMLRPSSQPSACMSRPNRLAKTSLTGFEPLRITPITGTRLCCASTATGARRVRARTSPGSRMDASAYALLNHMIRSTQYRWRDRKAKALGHLKVDSEFKSRWPLDRQILRLGALQNAVDVARDGPKHSDDARTIGHEAAVLHVVPELVDRGESILGGESDQLAAVRTENGRRHYHDGPGVLALSRPEGRLVFLCRPDLQRFDHEPDTPRRGLGGTYEGVFRARENREPREAG